MDFEAAITIILVVIVIYIMYKAGCPQAKGAQTQKAASPVAPAPAAETMCEAKQANAAPKQGVESYDQKINKSLAENSEFFQTCRIDSSSSSAGAAAPTDSGSTTFAEHPFGDSSANDYSEYVTSMGVDSQVVDNHMRFIEDRNETLGNDGETLTGKTYSPDSGIETEYISWTGLMKPYAPAGLMCNPTQVPDVPDEWYQRGQRLSIKSSGN